MSPKVPYHDHPALRVPAWPGSAWKQALKAISHYQWSKTRVVPSPTLFSVFLCIMLSRAMEDLDEEEGVYIRLAPTIYDDSRPKPRQWRDTYESYCSEMMLPLLLIIEIALERITSCFAAACDLFSLVVSIKKTEVLHQPAPQVVSWPPSISINGTLLNSIQQFCYLESIISSDAKIDKDMDNRLAWGEQYIRQAVWVTLEQQRPQASH